MTVHDLDDLDVLWRDALEQLAPVAGEPAPERVRHRVAVRRRRRWTIGGALTCIPFLIAAPLLPHSHTTTRIEVASRPATSVITAVLNDNGLHFTPNDIAAAYYKVHFVDRRSDQSRPATLVFAASGPGIIYLRVPAGTTSTADLLCGGAVETGLVFNKDQQLPSPPYGDLVITPSKKCTTPVT
jgi:hypothetical protein